MKKQEEKEKESQKNLNEVYQTDPNGTYSKAGQEELGSLPNDPAANAKKTSPEQDAGKKEDTRLKAGDKRPAKTT